MTDSTSPIGSSAASDATLGALFATATRDVSTLLRSEIELAKVEIKEEVQQGAKGGAMFAAAGVLAFLAVVLLLIAAAYGLVEVGVPRWLAFLIVAVVILVIAGILVLVGRRVMSKLGPPERAIRSSKETAAYLKGSLSTDASSG